MTSIKFERRRQVQARFDLGTTSFYDHIKRGLLPPTVRLGPKAAGLPVHEVDELAAARLAGKTDDEIRTIVRRMVADRARAYDRFTA